MIDDELRREVRRRVDHITERQIVNLMEKAAKAAENRLIENAVLPIMEFIPIKTPSQTRERNWHIFSSKADPDLSGLEKRLQQAHEIYVFHDSSGRAIYAGKAERQRLWSEINQAFNRSRGAVQSIWRVESRASPVRWEGQEKRQIKKVPVALYEIASYVSAYEVLPELIGKFEALIMRSFAHDLLNVRMEKF
jgi:hypothetical protein